MFGILLADAKVGKILSFSTAYASELSSKFVWVARCDQWDAHVQATIDRAFLSEAAKQARERVAAFTGLLEKSRAALDRVSLESVPLRDIASAMKIACDGLRLEEGLATAHIAVQVSDVRTVLGRLPAEVRIPLLQALAMNLEIEPADDDDETGYDLDVIDAEFNPQPGGDTGDNTGGERDADEREGYEDPPVG